VWYVRFGKSLGARTASKATTLSACFKKEPLHFHSRRIETSENNLHFMASSTSNLSQIIRTLTRIRISLTHLSITSIHQPSSSTRSFNHFTRYAFQFNKKYQGICPDQARKSLPNQKHPKPFQASSSRNTPQKQVIAVAVAVIYRVSSSHLQNQRKKKMSSSNAPSVVSQTPPCPRETEKNIPTKCNPPFINPQ
jgi:hypothetical protein